MIENNEIKMLAVGDIGLIGQVAENINTLGAHHPFMHVSEHLTNSDILFGNLEMPFSDQGSDYSKSHQSKHFHHNDNAIDSLRHAGFSILSLANNHIMECGDQGLVKTITMLDSNKIRHVGAGTNINDAKSYNIIILKDTKIGFLAFSMKSSDSATDSKSGFAPIILNEIIENIKLLKHEVDFIVVSLHFGMMYMESPRPEDIETCHAIIDSGANVVLGHHPHVLQGVEQYKNGFIFYSLGEFIFDRKCGVRFVDLGSDIRRKSMILEIYFKKHESIRYNLTPTYLNDDYQVVISTNDKAINDIERFKKLSSNLLDTKQYYEEAGSKLVGYELGGLFFHLKRGNFRYIVSKLSNLRIRHFRLFIGYIKRKILFFL